jgi:hypothetical protein
MGGLATRRTVPRCVSRAVLLLPADVVASTDEIAPLIIGEGGLLDADADPATVTALTETESLTLEAATLAAISESFPEASTRLLRVMSRHSPVAGRR